MVILKRFNVTLFSSILAFISVFALPLTKNSFATGYCTSEKCKTAEANEIKAKQNAAEASAAANSFEEEVARLTNEIKIIEAEITSLEAKAEDLSKEIKENEEKLEKQQKALAKLVVEMHFETDIDPIMILAGSATISDLAEKEAREETVEYQVSASSKEIKSIKEKLEQEKSDVDLMISDANKKRNEVAQAKARQKSLADKYRSDASSYLADAQKARQEKEAEIEKARQDYLNSIGRDKRVLVDPGLDSYAPALYADERYSCPKDNWRYYKTNGHNGYYSWHGGYICECTGYAGYKAYEYWNKNVGWGDAKYWGSGATTSGFTVDSNPAPHSIGFVTYGTWGHVVWIENVNSDGTIDYSEYNGQYTASFSYVKGVSANKFRYIHLD